MTRIPQKKEFVTTTFPDQYMQHWSVDDSVTKTDPMTLIKKTRIIPKDRIFRSKTAFTDIDESKTHL